jgi:UDP-N-acetylmuramyl pentapeptide phosphotransferase/UDP-N-acetylglucosamine-1-phosphate transferase
MMQGLMISAAAVAGLSAGLCTLIVLSQRWHGKHTLDHDLEGVQKFHTTAVPRIGGVGIVAAILIAVIYRQAGAVTEFSNWNSSTAMLLLLAGAPAFLAGFVEDMTKVVSVRARLLASVLSALLASWLVHATIDELNIWGIDALMVFSPIALVVTAVVVAGGVNAINIIDGFNGLAGSTVVVMLAALAAVGVNVGDKMVTELAILGMAAAAGFLMVNFPSGRLFLGDGGAYFLGFWVSEVAVLLLVRNSSVNAWQILSICAYPVIEVLFSIYRRKLVRQASPGSPDGLHLHTLVYRRVVPRLLGSTIRPSWKRNAAVTCVIVPWIGTAALLSVIGGTSIGGGIALVVAQVVAYVLVYQRVVRGRWRRRAPTSLQQEVITVDNELRIANVTKPIQGIGSIRRGENAR